MNKKNQKNIISIYCDLNPTDSSDPTDSNDPDDGGGNDPGDPIDNDGGSGSGSGGGGSGSGSGDGSTGSGSGTGGGGGCFMYTVAVCCNGGFCDAHSPRSNPNVAGGICSGLGEYTVLECSDANFSGHINQSESNFISPTITPCPDDEVVVIKIKNMIEDPCKREIEDIVLNNNHPIIQNIANYFHNEPNINLIINQVPNLPNNAAARTNPIGDCTVDGVCNCEITLNEQWLNSAKDLSIA